MSLQTKQVLKQSRLRVWWLGKGADLVGGVLIAMFIMTTYVALSIAVVFLWRSANYGLQAIALLFALAMVVGAQLLIKD